MNFGCLILLPLTTIFNFLIHNNEIAIGIKTNNIVEIYIEKCGGLPKIVYITFKTMKKAVIKTSPL
jgi:hypothetical protein